jgi:hypothetical protein
MALPLGVPLSVGCEMDDQQADDEGAQSGQCRDDHSGCHRGSPFLSINPTASVVKLIAIEAKPNCGSIGLPATNRSSRGKTATLCDAPNGRGGAWADDGTIVFSPNNAAQIRLLRVSSAGGMPQAVADLAEGETTQRWPQILPRGRGVLYSSAPTQTAWEMASLVVLPDRDNVFLICILTGRGSRFRRTSRRPSGATKWCSS